MSVNFVSASRNSVSIQRKIIQTCLDLCNYEEVPLQVCAYYCSAISAFIPGLKGVAIDTLKSFGVQIVHINETNLADQPRFESEEEEGVLLVHIGLAILVLYNDVFKQSYARLMRIWTLFLLAKIACFAEYILEDDEFPPLIAIEKAAIIRRMLGGMHGLRANVLTTILANRDESQTIGRVCSYLAEVVAWTDMSVPKIIGDTLLLTGSPVLTLPEIRDELHNLHAAFTKINQSSRPQYYGIMYPSSSSLIINESNFPYLFAIGREFFYDRVPKTVHPKPAEIRNRQKRERTPPPPEEGRLADELFRMYRQWVRISSTESSPRTVGSEASGPAEELITSEHSVTPIYTNHTMDFLFIDRMVALNARHMQTMEARGKFDRRKSIKRPWS